QRDYVCKSFVKRQHIRIAWFIETTMHTVKNRMCGFVRNDVVREAGVNSAAGHVISGIVGRRLEVAKVQPNGFGRVEGICLLKSVRLDRQLADKLAIVEWFVSNHLRAPKHRPAQSALKMFDSLHCHCVNHLLMKCGITFRWRTSILREQLRIV